MDATSHGPDIDSVFGVIEFIKCYHLSRVYKKLCNEYESGEIDRNTFVKKAVISQSYKSAFASKEQFALHLGICRSHMHRIVNGRALSASHVVGEGVYFLQCGQFVKIGWSKNLGRRMECIQVSNPHKVSLLFSWLYLQSFQ